jgi:hypothetical protein
MNLHKIQKGVNLPNLENAPKKSQQIGYWRIVMKNLSVEEIETLLTQILLKSFDLDQDNKDVSEEDF